MLMQNLKKKHVSLVDGRIPDPGDVVLDPDPTLEIFFYIIKIFVLKNDSGE